MMDRRSLMRYSGATALGMLALGAVESGLTPAEAFAAAPKHPDPYTPLPGPAKTPVPNPPYPQGLTPTERQHLKTFDELDFVVFSKAEWSRFGESHAQNIRVRNPDGSFTEAALRLA
jgi:hypothetical protein